MTRYSRVAILLHWSIAVLVLANLALGLRIGAVKGLAQFELFQLHKSIGITVLLLTVARIAWRVTHHPPPRDPALALIEQRAANLVHASFYILLMALPLTGWLLVSASRYNIPTLLFGAIRWPHIAAVHNAAPAERARIEAVAGTTHETLAWAMIALVALHVAGALKHHFIDRDATLSRMRPSLRRQDTDA